ncbi:lipase maturation factor family protein [Myxococcaceae bacterium GXIMD 01537]
MRADLTPPLVLYDGACGFCRQWVERWRARMRGRVLFVPMRAPLRWLLGIRRREARRAMQLVEPSGAVYAGAEAVFRMLGRSPYRGTRWAARWGRLPGVLQVSQVLYGVIARHRQGAARVDRLLLGRATRPMEHRVVRWVCLRLLGGVFLIAFTSLGRQVLGLYGARGIRPVAGLIGSEHLAALGRQRYENFPSVFWLGASDEALTWGCRAGQMLSLLLMVGVAPRLTSALLWGLYLSYCAVGREFLSFQWDVLLLEMGLLAAVTAPPGLWPGLGRSEPSALEVALWRLVFFRLYFGSGISKLRSGDEAWRQLRACSFYYETAPLPTVGGWYAHQLPQPFQRFSTGAVLVLEAAVPWLTFGPRRARQVAFWLLAGLQGTIIATGNYGFFNLLALVLGFWLLDDAALTGWARLGPPHRDKPVWRMGLDVSMGAPLAVLSVAEVLRRFERSREWVRPLERVDARLRPLRSVNSYGLFSVMTLERPEVIVEGSEDGVHWSPYTFRYKVGPVDARPRLVAPHQPRLDWQMWFAALGSPPSWLLELLHRLLEGSPDVLALLAANPFPERPPRVVRALLDDYQMTDRATRRATGAWWKHERLGLFVPPVTLAPDPEHPEGGGQLRWAGPPG